MPKKAIPTLIGLIIIAVGAFAGVMLLGQNTSFLPRAAPEFMPRQVKITNISDTSFTVSWITNEPAIGFIRYGTAESALNQTAVDERDQLSGSSQEYRSHYVTLQGLSPATRYYFKIGSQSDQLYDNNSNPFNILTAPQISQNSASDTAYGTILTPAATPASGAIVYITLEGATPLSALARQNGSWALDLSKARSLNLNSFVSYDPQSSNLEIFVQADDGQVATLTTSTGSDQPVPDIVIGESADYRDTSGTPQYQQFAPSDQELSSISSRFTLEDIEVTDQPASGGLNAGLSIITLPQDGTSLSLSQPVLVGTAPSDTTLTLNLSSNPPLTSSVQSDQEGSWTFTMPNPLPNGPYTISISGQDVSGQLLFLNRSFVIATTNTLDQTPVYQATPSANLSPSPTPLIPDPTSPPRVAIPATTSAQPVSGNLSSTLALLSIGSLFILSGAGFSLLIYYSNSKSS